jgi:hypothetical protein
MAAKKITVRSKTPKKKNIMLGKHISKYQANPPNGVYREVYFVGNFVVKIPKRGYVEFGKYANITEWKVWKKNKKSELLVPTLYSTPDGSCNIQPRCEIPEFSTKKERDAWHKVINGACKLGISDVHQGNVGYYDGKLCAFDYAG